MITALRLQNATGLRLSIAELESKRPQDQTTTELILWIFILLENGRCADARVFLGMLRRRPRNELLAAEASLGLRNSFLRLLVNRPAEDTPLGRLFRETVTEFADCIFADMERIRYHRVRQRQQSQRRIAAFPLASQAMPGVAVDIFTKLIASPGAAETLTTVATRWRAGLKLGGWDARVHDASLDRLRSVSPAGAVKLCLIDGQSGAYRTAAEFQAFASEARRRYDVVIVILVDAWLDQAVDILLAAQDDVDFFWSINGDAPFFADPRLRRPAILCPFPFGLDEAAVTTIAARKAPARRVRFLGRVRPFNIDRMFWLLALSRYEPFVEFVRSDVHAPLGNGRDEGARFADYLAELSETTGCCSLARRWNGTLTATGRTFEAVALGRVLVQEFAEEVRSFLVPEEHYLEFENLAELLEIAERIARADARLETVAQAGRAYFWNTYADHHIVRHLSHLLA